MTEYVRLSAKFFRILEWKAELYGRKIIRVKAKDTSKTCSRCGYVNHDLKLSDRVFKCPSCGLRIDRDLNASINILKKGLEHIAPSSGHGEYMPEMAISGWPIGRTPYWGMSVPIRIEVQSSQWGVCQKKLSIVQTSVSPRVGERRRG